jgi:hypothetical protein
MQARVFSYLVFHTSSYETFCVDLFKFVCFPTWCFIRARMKLSVLIFSCLDVSTGSFETFCVDSYELVCKTYAIFIYINSPDTRIIYNESS